LSCSMNRSIYILCPCFTCTGKIFVIRRILNFNVFPSAASTHFPLMNNCFVPFKNSETFGVVSITLANLISSRFYFFFYPARKPFYFIIEFVMMKYIESVVSGQRFHWQELKECILSIYPLLKYLNKNFQF